MATAISHSAAALPPNYLTSNASSTCSVLNSTRTMTAADFVGGFPSFPPRASTLHPSRAHCRSLSNRTTDWHSQSRKKPTRMKMAVHTAATKSSSLPELLAPRSGMRPRRRQRGAWRRSSPQSAKAPGANRSSPGSSSDSSGRACRAARCPGHRR
eukprot:6198316-Pleurochrysis_carterae.AAC.2